MGREVHLALGLVLCLLLLGFYLAGHLVLFTVHTVSDCCMAWSVRASSHTVEHRVGLWLLLAVENLSQALHANAPITRFTCANLRVFFCTPMMAAWSCRSLFGGAKKFELRYRYCCCQDLDLHRRNRAAVAEGSTTSTGGQTSGAG
jgi:hypothetical protein